MTTVYLICGLGGGAILLLQLVLSFIGLGDWSDAADAGDVDVDLDHGSSWFFGVLSFKALLAAVTFFGLGGLAGQEAGLGGPFSIIGGLFMGFVAMVIVAWLMRFLLRMQSDGNVHIENAIGQTGVVYLSVPAEKKGSGKVTVTLQDRTMEYLAITTEGADLPTGATVQVVGLAGPDTLVVAPARDSDLAIL